MAQANREPIEISGKTVDEAVQRALRDLRLSRSQVHVTVLSEGRPGIFGIGATSALVRVSPLGAGETADPPEEGESRPLPKIDDYAKYQEVSAPPRREERPRTGRGRSGRGGGRGGRGDRSGRGDGERQGGRMGDGRGPGAATNAPRRSDQPFELLADPEYEPEEDPVLHAANVLTDLLHLMGVEAEVSAREPKTPMDGVDHSAAVLDITPASADDDLSLLIGRRGEHLAALQYSVNLIVNRGLEGQHAFTVDVDGYKRRREDALNTLAERTAERVRETHETVALEPMSPAERRIVHLALADDPDVLTASVGEDDARRVEIVYREDV